MKRLSNILDESLFGNMSDKGRGETVKKEDIITSKAELKERINALYTEQGEEDTLDVSSLGKLITCDDLSVLFNNFNNVKQIIGLETWDVSNVTDTSYMFYNCESLTELNISNWDVSKVTDMHSMFSSCYCLKELNLSNWDVSNVIYMYDMFRFCESLTELDLSNWDVSKVIKMYSMFHNCWNLTKLNIDNWDVSNVTDMSYMFDDCKKLINKPKWYKDE